jgi:geranyl-CoA carboxylase alpha subunit
VRLAIDTVQQSVQYALIGRGEVAVQILGSACLLTNQLAFTKGDEEEGGSGTVTAPMHGNVLEVMVTVGDRVEPGQDLMVMEAMKMEHRLSAQVAGEVVAVHASVGEQVAAGAVVLEIAADED